MILQWQTKKTREEKTRGTKATVCLRDRWILTRPNSFGWTFYIPLLSGGKHSRCWCFRSSENKYISKVNYPGFCSFSKGHPFSFHAILRELAFKDIWFSTRYHDGRKLQMVSRIWACLPVFTPPMKEASESFRQRGFSSLPQRKKGELLLMDKILLTIRKGKYPISYRVSYMSGVAGCLPSAASLGRCFPSISPPVLLVTVGDS